MSGRCRRKRKLERNDRDCKYEWSEYHTFYGSKYYSFDVSVKKQKTVQLTNDDWLAVAQALSSLFEVKRYPRTKDVKTFLISKGKDELAKSIRKVCYL